MIRIWRENAILTDLELDEKGFGSWVTRPAMPDNAQRLPDLELDPWATTIRHQRGQVVDYAAAARSLLAEDDRCPCIDEAGA